MKCSFRDASDYYVSLGFKVFPLSPNTKLPAIKGGKGFKDATDDYHKIDLWQVYYPDANIAIATGEPSSILVVDVDPRNGGDETIAKLAGDGFVLPKTATAQTGNGGRHYIFRYRPDIRPSKNRLGPGIDIKTDGGYIVAAPSIIAASDAGPGGEYKWLLWPHKAGISTLPAWAVEKLMPRKVSVPKFKENRITGGSAERALESMARKLAASKQGERNNLLNWCAYHAMQMANEGKLSPSLAMHRITQAALSAGLPMPEVQATLQSGLRGAIEKAGEK